MIPMTTLFDDLLPNALWDAIKWAAPFLFGTVFIGLGKRIQSELQTRLKPPEIAGALAPTDILLHSARVFFGFFGLSLVICVICGTFNDRSWPIHALGWAGILIVWTAFLVSFGADRRALAADIVAVNPEAQESVVYRWSAYVLWAIYFGGFVYLLYFFHPSASN